jgi:hypothetical protein
MSKRKKMRMKLNSLWGGGGSSGESGGKGGGGKKNRNKNVVEDSVVNKSNY